MKRPPGSDAKPTSRKPKRHPGGRPTDYDPAIHPRLMERLAMLGASDVQIADALGVARSTLYLWREKHPEFSDSARKGRTLTDANIARSLARRAMGIRVKLDGRTAYFPPDTNAAIFWLVNRAPGAWRHISRIEHTGANGGPIETTDLSRLDAGQLAQLEALLSAAGVEPAKQIEAVETIEVVAEEVEDER